jgi:hypothetical protein
MNGTGFFVPPQIIEAMTATRAALAGDTLEKFKALLAEPQTSSEEFRKLLPPEGLIALLAASPQNVPPELPPSISRTVAPLTELVKAEFPGLLNHSGFNRSAVESLQATQHAAKAEAGLQPKSITGVAADHMLIGEGDVLAPVLRIMLQMTPSEDKVEFFASSSDLLFLARAFAEHLAETLEQRASLAGKGFIKIFNSEAIARNLADVERALEKIRQFAPQFGIVLETSEKSASRSEPTD